MLLVTVNPGTAWMAEIRLVDVSLRDGNQSLWGAAGLRTAHVATIAPLLGRVGFRALDYSSSTAMGMSVRRHREDPWALLRISRAAMPDTPLQFIGTGFRFISWERAHPEVIELVYRKLVDNGMDRFVVLDPSHDMDAARATARIAKKAGGREVIGALTYTISAVHDDAFYAGIAAAYRDCPDIDRAYIKDPAGILTPDRARTLIPAVQAALGGKPLELHSHATLGLSQLTCLTAASLGVHVLQVGCGALGNWSSLPDAEQLLANLRASGHTVDIDDRLLAAVARYFDRLAAAEGLPPGQPGSFDAAFMDHQLAGGTLSTTRRQLREIGLADRFDALMAEIAQVRAELGYPIMVTPYPQMVIGQALANLLSVQAGNARYDNVPDQVIRYALGTFGKPTAPVEPWVLDKVLGQASGQPNSPTSRHATDGLRRAAPAVRQPDQRRGTAAAFRHAGRGGRRDGRRRARGHPLQPGPGAGAHAPALPGRTPRGTGADGGQAGLPAVPARPRALTVERSVVTTASSTTGISDEALRRLRDARGFIFDMDGTLALGDRVNHGLAPLPGAVELLHWVRGHGLPYVVFTNGTNRSPADFAAVLRDAGLDAPDDQMMTPASSAVVMFTRRGYKRVMVLGGEGLTGPLRAAGIEVVPPVEAAPDTRPSDAPSDVDAVLVGWFREFTMSHLEAACHAVWSGAALYSASQTPFFATAGGRALGTSRAISAMVRSVTGCRLTVTGSRQLDALRAAATRLGVPASRPRGGRRRPGCSRCRWRTAVTRRRSRCRPAWPGPTPKRPPAARQKAAPAPARRR